MLSPMAFEVVDVDVATPRGWATALAPHRRAALRLLDGFDAQCLDAVTAARGSSGRVAFRGLRRLLAALAGSRAGPRTGEISALARVLGVGRARLLFANLAYDVAAAAPPQMVEPLAPGCSTFVAAGAAPLHARNLDWHFPGTLLQEHPLLFRVRGAPAGAYLAVGWPGLTGVLTAVAPGRFSISVNFVKLRGDHFGKLLARAAAGATPVGWAVREAVERAPDFDAAVAMLRRSRLLAPVLLTVAGVRPGQACVIERAPRSAGVRWCADAPADVCAAGTVCVTNHYGSAELRGRSVDYDGGDTLVRLGAVTRGLGARTPEAVDAALEVLAPAVRGHTQHQAVMRAAEGLLAVRVPGGELKVA
jgi:hypothetical protein